MLSLPLHNELPEAPIDAEIILADWLFGDRRVVLRHQPSCDGRTFICARQAPSSDSLPAECLKMLRLRA